MPAHCSAPAATTSRAPNLRSSAERPPPFQAKGYGWTAVRFDSVEERTTDVRVALAPSGTVEVRVDPSLLAGPVAGEGRLVVQPLGHTYEQFGAYAGML